MSESSEELPGTDCATNGLTVREHAAILLRVPQSGSAWLDAMIRQSNRLELAKAAVRLPGIHYEQPDKLIDAAFAMADGMLSRCEQAEEPSEVPCNSCDDGYFLIDEDTPIQSGDEIKGTWSSGWLMLGANNYGLTRKQLVERDAIRPGRAIWRFPIRRRLIEKYYIDDQINDGYITHRNDGTVLEKRISGYVAPYHSLELFTLMVWRERFREVSKEQAIEHMLKAEKE